MSNQTHQVELAPVEPVVRPVSLASPPAHLQALRDVVVGTQVVYPVHGVAMVVGHETRTVGAETQHYLVLLIRGELRSDDLTIHVLADRLEDLGVRHTMSAEDAGDVLKVLAVRSLT
jgi:RNA polymerase-interacting CarD/CdnL/TRCF family regulator